jgi:putative ABC transport system permease protein
MGLVFSIAANERRWEFGVLRALGFPQAFILKSLLVEGAVLAFTGGLFGAIIGGALLLALGGHAVQVAGLPLHTPSPGGLLASSLGGQVAALLSVTVAALVPAWRISKQDVSLAMRD